MTCFAVDDTSRGDDREDERLRLRVFADFDCGSAGALVLAGEQGIGKTTLWRESVDDARARGWRVLAATAAEAEAEMPYVVLEDLLGEVVDEVPPLSEPRRLALEVAMGRVRAATVPPAPRMVAAAVREVLQRCTDQGPVLLAVDNAQWVDDATHQAVTFAVRRLAGQRIRLLSAMRTPMFGGPAQAGGETLKALLHAVPGATCVRVPPLSAARVRELLKQRLGAPVNRADAEWIATSTRGNPFWVAEFGAAMAGARRSPGDPLPVPSSLQSLVTGRLDALEEDVIEALCVVSAIGLPSRPQVLRTLQPPLSDPDRALDAAITEGVVIEANGRIAAAHPLLGTAIIDSLPPGRRARLHQRVAETSTSCAEGANHLAMAYTAAVGEPGPDQEVAAALDAAADHERARGATAIATLLAERALRFTADDDFGMQLSRRVTAARLAFLNSDFARVIELLGSVDLARLDADSLERVLPLLADSYYLLHGEAAGRTVVARAQAGALDDPRCRSVVLTLASDANYGTPGNRESLAREAVRCAEESGLGGLSLHHAYGGLIDARLDQGHGLDAELLERSELLESDGLLTTVGDSAEARRAFHLKRVDDIAGSGAALERGLRLARSRGDDIGSVLFCAHTAEAELLAGRLEYAERALAEAERLTDHWDCAVPSLLLQVRGELLLARDRPEAVVELVTTCLQQDARGAHQRMTAGYLLGLVAVRRGEQERALELFLDVRDEAERAGIRETGSRMRVDFWLGEQLVAAERLEEAAQVADHLRSLDVNGDRPALCGVADRILGLCAAKLGDLDVAYDLLTSAVTELESSQLRPELARGLLELGRLQRRRRARAAARVCLERAMTLFNEMGFKPYAGVARAELGRVSGGRAATELTSSELRVAAAVAAGATNREAAVTLFVSVRTVETHLASVYRKLGLRSRRDLIGLFDTPPVGVDAAGRGPLARVPGARVSADNDRARRRL